MRAFRSSLAALAAAVLAGPAGAGEAPRSRGSEALHALFPEAERFEARDLLLDGATAARLAELARARVDDRMVTFYTARRGSAIAGYAAIHSHVVRTKRETFAIAFETDGRIRRIVILAFLEPPEYQPAERWLAQLHGKGAEDRLAVGDDLLPIAGATLSARGIAERSRWLLRALQEARRKGEVP
jgi:hypothetical protein